MFFSKEITKEPHPEIHNKQSKFIMDLQIITSRDEIRAFINDSIESAFSHLILTPKASEEIRDERPITVKEMCDFLNVTEPTIIRWRKKGKIPFLQIGSRVLFQKSAVLKALENKKGVSK